jgi:hypothetical protein
MIKSETKQESMQTNASDLLKWLKLDLKIIQMGCTSSFNDIGPVLTRPVSTPGTTHAGPWITND